MKPFTLKSLASELRTTDVALRHLMLSLLDKNIVRKKEFGKRNKEIYYVDLDKAMAKLAGPEGLQRASVEETQAAKMELQRCMAKDAELQREMKSVLHELSNSDLGKRLKDEEEELEKLRARVIAAKGRISNSNDRKTSNKVGARASTFRFSREAASSNLTSKQIKVRFNYMRAEWRERREKCNDFIDNLADAMEKKLKDVHRLLDIETDKMAAVTMPPKKVIET